MPKHRKGKSAAVQALGESSSGQIVVTAQQSRFHVDAVDAPDSKEVDIKDIGIAIGGKKILEHTRLRIKEAVHYVLAGRNGTGKSTLLRALAEGRIPGVPWNLRILLLGQTRLVLSDKLGDEDATARSDEEEETVIQHVIRSDERRERTLKEAELLSTALDDVKDPLAAVKAARRINYERLKRELLERQQIASRRSGARGLQARQVLIKTEEEVEEAKRLIEEENEAIEPSCVADETNAAIAMLDSLHLSLESTDSSKTESIARTTLLGLGFTKSMIDAPFSSLSGGWKTRCDLASALTQSCNLLLLDEPTNFLDLPAVIWLQHYIQNNLGNTSVVVVTHDRSFADAVADELILLKMNPACTLDYFKGNLSAYYADLQKQVIRMTRMRDAQSKKTAHMQSSISSNLRAAKRTGDDKKLKQAASRKKKLEERTGLEVSAKGTRFKLSRDLVGYYLTARAEIEIPDMDPPVNITLPAEGAPLRFPGPIISLENVTFRYPGTPLPQKVLNCVNLVVHSGERVAIIGLNGAGKSTLVDLMTGSLTATSGTITRHSRARIAMFSQDAVEALTTVAADQPSLTALRYLLQKQGLPETSAEADSSTRALLGGLGVRGATAASTPLASLSGGQKVRVALAETLVQEPHLLVLDEVTTHLDSDTIRALAEALDDWTGALAVVSHDRWFVRRVVERQPDEGEDGVDGDGPDEECNARDENEVEIGKVYLLKKGVLELLEGGMSDYEDVLEKRMLKKFK